MTTVVACIALMRNVFARTSFVFASVFFVLPAIASSEEPTYVFEAGHPSLQKWLLPETPPYPADNAPSPERIALGKKLFFDPRLSGDGSVSCASCHNPLLGWADGMKTAKGIHGETLRRATPTIVNTAYNPIQMWDGGKATLEQQALGPMENFAEMNSNITLFIAMLESNAEYRDLFKRAYPGEGINSQTIGKAIANYERTIVSRNSRFDAWVKGDKNALSKQEIAGFKLFVDSAKGNCEVCHSAPNFTDNGFHNLGLAQFADPEADVGRFAVRPLKLMKGAFKTPTLRDVSLTAPYFHDGSAKDLAEVIEHYAQGGVVKTNLSPNMKALTLSQEEKAAIAAFVQSLTAESAPVELPKLPL